MVSPTVTATPRSRAPIHLRVGRWTAALVVLLVCHAAPVAAETSHRAAADNGAASASAPAVQREPVTAKPPLDRSGHKRTGKASFYGPQFSGKTMADGTPMNPHDDNAASKTLPLGTTAQVTNLETGKSAVVTIQDRGPYVKGRIVDLSPATASKIGITPKHGVANVEVKPLALPDPPASGDASAGAK